MKPGDKVMLVWACCAEGRAHIGWVGTLEGIFYCKSFCPRCIAFDATEHGVITIQQTGAVPLSWLRKMPDDPAELVGDEVSEETPA